MSNSQLYEVDFYAWVNEQAELLRAGRLSEADLDNIVEEIESMGRREKRELVSRLSILLLHLLKWRHQPGLRGNSWRGSIRVQRLELTRHLRDNPSLKAHLSEGIEDAYRVAVIAAESQTGLPEAVFPLSCPWAVEQMMDEGFWPEG